MVLGFVLLSDFTGTDTIGVLDAGGASLQESTSKQASRMQYIILAIVLIHFKPDAKKQGF